MRISPTVALITIKTPTDAHAQRLNNICNRLLPADAGFDPKAVANALLNVGTYADVGSVAQLFAEAERWNANPAAFDPTGTLVGEIANQVWTAVSPLDWTTTGDPKQVFPWASILQLLLPILMSLLGGCTPIPTPAK